MDQPGPAGPARPAKLGHAHAALTSNYHAARVCVEYTHKPIRLNLGNVRRKENLPLQLACKHQTASTL